MDGGSWDLMGEQLLAVGAALVWSFVLTIVIVGPRPGDAGWDPRSAEDEEMGLDHAALRDRLPLERV
jgi:ammonia channel protein AmtB